MQTTAVRFVKSGDTQGIDEQRPSAERAPHHRPLAWRQQSLMIVIIARGANMIYNEVLPCNPQGLLNV